MMRPRRHRLMLLLLLLPPPLLLWNYWTGPTTQCQMIA
jgi:hypothetical protein